MKRRSFLQYSLLGAGAMTLPRMALAFAPGHKGGAASILVTIFLRGGADGLNMVVPHGDPDYYRLRPALAVPRPGQGEAAAIDLDGFFGLHPSLSPLMPLYQSGALALAQACGAVHGSRSHFDAQALMERGVADPSLAQSGWMGRLAEQIPGAVSVPFTAVAIGNAVPRSLAGTVAAMGIGELGGFNLRAPGARHALVRAAIEQSYGGDSMLGAVGRQALDAIDLLAAADPLQFAPREGSDYPDTGFGSGLMQLAQLIKADVGLRLASVDIGGWDHHQGEAQVLPPLLDELARALAAFHHDLGEDSARVTVAVMSEFGRRAAQNGSGGTDHGAGNTMMLLGGGVNGGRVLADWPGLRDSDLDRGDLRVTLDYRQPLAEFVETHLGSFDLDYVLQDYRPGAPLGLF